MKPNEVRVFFEPMDRLRATVIDDRSYLTVKPVWATPLSAPGHNLVLLDEKGNEIVMAQTLKEFDEASQRAIAEELHRRYLTAKVRRIIGARVEFGATYWTVETDRGVREFVTQSLQENVQWATPTRILLIDVDGNRFEILDTEALDANSRAVLDRTI